MPVAHVFESALLSEADLYKNEVSEQQHIEYLKETFARGQERKFIYYKVNDRA